MILLDTDTCIEILRANEKVIVRRETTTEDVWTSFMTVCELFYGARKSPNPADNTVLVEEFLLTISIQESNRSIAKLFGTIKSDLAEKGTLLADADILIASTALCSNATLITGNLRHYERIEGLEIENWIR